jgi:hypothetical protein
VRSPLFTLSPTASNINAACGSTHLESLLEALGHGSYDFGFAYDGGRRPFHGLQLTMAISSMAMP